MVTRTSHAARVASSASTAALLVALFCGFGAAGQQPRVDQSNITRTAQDATGVVWAAHPGESRALYRWEGDHWAPAPVEMPGLASAIGVWPGGNGGVVALWLNVPPHMAELTWQHGDQFKLLGTLDALLGRVRVFSTPPDNLWITANSPSIYKLAGDGSMQAVYTFQPSQFFAYRHPPNQATLYCPLDVTVDGQGRTWFWSNSIGQFSNMAPARGFVVYDGHSFEYHPTIPGLPDRGVTYLGRVDGTHLWAAMLRDGVYSVDTVKMTARRIPDPQPKAFQRVTKIFPVGRDIYVVASPPMRTVAETSEHRYSSVLWRRRKGRWQMALAGIDDIPDRTKDLDRPWLKTPEGLWLGSHGAGLWFLPSHAKQPRLIDWRQQFPLDSVDRLYQLPDHKLLAVDLSPSRAVAMAAETLLRPAQPVKRVQVINPFSLIQPDQRFHMWGILGIRENALDEWDGEKWIAHPLPGNLIAPWLSGLDADSQGRIWLFPGCQQGPIAIFNPRDQEWTPYPSYQAALEASLGHPLRFLNSVEDRMAPIYGPRRQIVFMGACNGINYFDGSAWRLWNRPQMPGDPHYFFDAPAFFDAAGHLAVNIHHETWERGANAAWYLIPYQPRSGHLARWFVPSPAAPPPPGCSFNHSTSLTHDRLGRSWWTWQGDVYVGVAGLCKPLFAPTTPQPFVDGRLLRRVLIDSQGNVFFETLLARNRLGEYVIFRPSEPLPRTTLHLTRLSPDSIRANFSTTASGKVMFTWRLDEGAWSAPEEQNYVVMQSLPAGEHEIEAASINSLLNMDPIPASASVYIGIKPRQQIADLISRLAGATNDNQREAAVRLLEQQPPAEALPALRAARTQAGATERWWIDAAIQQLEQRAKQ